MDYIDPVWRNFSFEIIPLNFEIFQFEIIFKTLITKKVISGLYSGVTTLELDNLAAETAATMTTKHPDYTILAARIAISNLHKETKKAFSGNYI